MLRRDRAELEFRRAARQAQKVMPGPVNGRQLADEAQRRRPGLRVLFTTRYTRNAIVHQGRIDPGMHLIGKPFSFNELGIKDRALLDEVTRR